MILLAVGGGLTVLLRLLGASTLPAVYDGLPLPADPYRYVDPPAGVHNPGPPFSAHTTFQLVGGGNPAIDLGTGEFPPQAELALYHGDVAGIVPGVPAVTSAQVTITPVPPPAEPPPAGRQFHGNVYRLQVVAAGHVLGLNPGALATVSLRQPKSSAAGPQIAVLIGGRWELLNTHRTSGAGVVSAPLPQLGDVAILEKTSGFIAPRGHFGLWLGSGLALLALAALLAVRLHRTRGSSESRRSGSVITR